MVAPYSVSLYTRGVNEILVRLGPGEDREGFKLLGPKTKLEIAGCEPDRVKCLQILMQCGLSIKFRRSGPPVEELLMESFWRAFNFLPTRPTTMLKTVNNISMASWEAEFSEKDVLWYALYHRL
jgi:hypothetical protein